MTWCTSAVAQHDAMVDQTHEAGSFGHEPAPRIAADDVLHEQRPRGRSDVRSARLDEGGRQPGRADVLVGQHRIHQLLE